ncbi:MAG: hypothetical protein LUC97_03330 [Clostridiales bacterium]|nr:hypothetical protein [Clostridiales bacterium]
MTSDIIINSETYDGTNGSRLTEWTPIGTGASPFTGSFDGGGYTISGLYFNETQNYVGLFGYISSAEIENATVDNCYFYGRAIGGICGYSLNSEISDCTVKGTIVGTENSTTNCFAGGICGFGTASKITDCTNEANVIGDGCLVGGICGYNYSSSVIDSYINIGTVTSTGQNIGGICGYNQYSSSITNCTNKGTINNNKYLTGSGNILSDIQNAYTGGICGYNTHYAAISNCINEGAVNNDYCKTGGICGYNYYYASVENCTNNGDVTSGSRYTGGICGYNGAANKYKRTSTVTGCVNTGDVKITGLDLDELMTYFNIESDDDWSLSEEDLSDFKEYMDADVAGGICGCIDVYSTVQSCRNSGSVRGNSFIGGISGAMTGNYSDSITSTMTGCYNSGSITCDYKCAAGICADNYYAVITNCYNTGSVTNTGSGDYAGGICAKTGGGSISNCYNSGSLTVSSESSYIGGIAGNSGYTEDDGEVISATEISSCYYLNTASAGIGITTDETDSTAAKTETQFASGGVAWLLSGEDDSGEVWLQTIGTDNYPLLTVFDPDSLIVVELTEKDSGDTLYANILEKGISVTTDGSGNVTGITIDSSVYGGDPSEAAYLESVDIVIDGTLYQISEYYYSDTAEQYAFFPVTGESEKSGAVRGEISTFDSSETERYYVTAAESYTITASE